MAKGFDYLNENLKVAWQELLSQSKFVQGVRDREFDRDLYAMYMIETYHYTKHNAKNQALVAVRSSADMSAAYMKFCLHHAEEETGHEMMALHDMLSISGIKLRDLNMPSPLCATEALIGYLYWISAQGNPIQRLGYSYWAEASYEHINPLITIIREHLQLKPSQLTFFIAHSDIDAEHAEEVKEIMSKCAKSEEDWEAINDVMLKSLKLTGHMIEEVWHEYVKYRSGQPSRYDFLRTLPRSS